jgi:hypothetical protein
VAQLIFEGNLSHNSKNKKPMKSDLLLDLFNSVLVADFRIQFPLLKPEEINTLTELYSQHEHSRIFVAKPNRRCSKSYRV